MKASYKYFREKTFLDLLLTEAVQNDKIDFHAVTAQLHGLYVAAADTLKNALTWLVLVLAENPEIQEKCFVELKKISENDLVNQSDCHFTNSVLRENFRMFPVVDSLGHYCTEDLMIGHRVLKIVKTAF